MHNLPIGVFDSGLGGLTVVMRIFQHLPQESVLYFGDSQRAPYGSRSPHEIKLFVTQIVEELIGRGVKAVVMACNTSSALTLPEMANRYSIPLLGVIEPAALEARALIDQGPIGVLANPVTVRSGAYRRALRRWGNGVVIRQRACPQLVPLVENGQVDSAAAQRALDGYLRPLRAARIRTLILGCTHYPYFIPGIRKIMGDSLRIIDPGQAAVLELARVLEAQGLRSEAPGSPCHHFITSGDPLRFQRLGERLLGRGMPPVESIRWPETGNRAGRISMKTRPELIRR